MAAKRTSSIDSGLLSSEPQVNREETLVKPVFSTPGNETSKSKSNEQSSKMSSEQRTRSAEYLSNRRSFHAMPTTAASSSKDSDSDLGIVPDVTRLLLGSRHRRPKHPTSPTYSIHINSLYVYQNPAIPVENPMYQQFPAGKRDDKPPPPCSKPGYQYVWPSTNNTEDEKQPAQHSDSFGSAKTRPSSLHLSSTSKEENDSGYVRKTEPYLTQLTFPSSALEEGEEMEIMIKGKEGKSRRYKLQPITEHTSGNDAFVMNTTGDDTVIMQGFTINDPDEAFSETRSRHSSSVSTFTSSNVSGAAIETTVDDCKVTVDKAFQSVSSGKDEAISIPNPEKHISMSAEDISSSAALPTIHKYSAESSPNILQNPFKPANRLAGSVSQSVPNIAIATKIDTCYECRNEKRGGIFSKRKLPRSCTLDGFYHITDEHEVSLMKEILDQNGKLGNWFITPTSNQPGYDSYLYVKTKREVTSFPIAVNKKKKIFLDFSMKKSFPCLCKLVEFYKSTHLPSVNINLGQPLPKNAFPDMNTGADSSGTLKLQYAGVKL